MRGEPPQLELELRRSAGTAVLRLGADTIPGFVERIDLHEGVAVVSTTQFSPPADGGPQPVGLQLAPWVKRPADVTVVVFYRRRQPGCQVPAPLARSSFHLHPSQVKDSEMTQPGQLQEGTPADTPVGVSATLDFGTSRAAGGVFDIRQVVGDDGAPPVDGLKRAEKLLKLNPEVGIDRCLNIEMATKARPLRRAAAWWEIFDSPPLALNHLAATKIRSSDLAVEGTRVDFAEDVAGARPRLRGVKRYLADDPDHEVPGTGMQGSELFPEIYRRFAELVRRELELPASIGRIHVTFPTKLPPDRRDKLHDLLRGLAPQVEMNIDEAAAAAGFFLMKRFGADPLLGVEAFKLHARSPEGQRAWEEPQLWESWDEARRWHENILVIDVGGGTTDSALVKVAVADVTPSEGVPCPGRYYQLQPQVLASGGRLHLGGDLLTLNLFRKLKQRLGVPKTETIFKGLEEQEAIPRRRAFDVLWDAAEEVKHRGLSGSEACDVEVVPADGAPAEADRAVVQIPVKDLTKGMQVPVTITAADFSEIVNPVVNRIAALAAGIAAGGLEVYHRETEQTEQMRYRQSVDRVVLSGGTMMADSIRSKIEDSLRRRFGADGLDSTFALEFDPAFCKTGTALGGMYLNAVADLCPQPDDANVIRRLREGMSFFAVDSSRLHVNLAADFCILQNTQGVDWDRPLFRRGQALGNYGGATGKKRAAYAESEFSYPVVPQIEVHRFDVLGERTEAGNRGETLWASYEGISQDLAKQLAERHLEMCFEIDEEERLTLILRRGEPGWVLNGEPMKLLSPPRDGLVRDNHLADDLYLDVLQPGVGVQRPQALLTAQTRVPKVVPISGSQLYLRARDPERPYELLLEIPAGRRWLSIDAEGGVRTHERHPEPLTVDAPAQLLDASDGYVCRISMTSRPLLDPDKDPFNGRH